MELTAGDKVTARITRPRVSGGTEGRVIERGTAGSVYVLWETGERTTAWPEDLVPVPVPVLAGP
jgi:hypothetical protein